MNQIPFGRAVRSAVLLCGIVTAVAPAAALASTYTVDDDKQQCPNASFTSIQAAVNQAAPHDTIKVCAGLYQESSTPVNSAANPAQAGSTNGLTITKPLNIVGAGAGKVTIEPAPSLGRSLAGTAPYLRDGGGNVVTISRQSLGSTDADENAVNVSGVTIESPDAYAEADVAYFNTSGTISDSVIGPIASPASVGSDTTAEPYGYGVIETNSLQGSGPGSGTVRREVDVDGSLVTGYQAGGILFDDSLGADGAASVDQRSGIIQYGYVDHTRVAGDGSTAGQVGVEYRAGQQGSVTSSEIAANAGDGVLLADADTRASDPDDPAVPSFFMDGDSLTGNGNGIFNAAIDGVTVNDADPALATGADGNGANWFGCPTGPSAIGVTNLDATCQTISGLNAATPAAPSVAFAYMRAAPDPLSVPVPTTDDAPGVSIADPLDGGSVTAGVAADPVVAATDDFGVRSVSLTADGVPLGTVGHTPYEFSWTPSADEIGSTVALTATATDSSGQTSTTTIHVAVAAPAGYTPIEISPSAIDFGSLAVGSSTTKSFTVTDSGDVLLDLTGLDVAGSGFAVDPSSTCTTHTSLEPGASCTVAVAFTPVQAAAHAGYVQVSYDAPGASGPIAVALTGLGTPAPAGGGGDNGGTGGTGGGGGGPAPVTLAKPTVGGTAVVGKTLTCASNTPGVTYQWLRDGKPIAGAMSASYALAKDDTDTTVACEVSAGGAKATSAAKRVTYPKSTTKTKVTEQDGPAILTLTRTIKGASKLTLGSVACVRAEAKTCKVTVTGTLKLGKSSYKVALTKSVTRGKSAALTLAVPAKAAKAVKTTAGTLKLALAVKDDTGAKGSVAASLKTKKA